MEKNKIFLSHRHSDTQSDCHRIRETLEEEFGEHAVFLDIENLEPGIRFADAIEKALAESKVVLVAIGPGWFGDPNENGVTRLFQNNDWVRREVSAALSRSDTRVIPLLLKGATRPMAEQLPADLKELADLQTFEISITRWKYDLGVLVEALAKLIPKKKKNINPIPTRPVLKSQKGWWARNYLWGLGIFVVLIIIIGSWPEEDYLYDPVIGPKSETPAVTDLPEEEKISPQGETRSGNEIYKLQPEENYDQPTLEVFNYSGKWWLWENDIRSGYFLISQNGNYFQFDYYYFDQKVGNGTGEYDGTYIYTTEFDLFADDQVYAFSFGSYDQGKSWDGQTFVNGLPTLARLIKD
jgi:hypothetical protein